MTFYNKNLYKKDITNDIIEINLALMSLVSLD